jgi:ABC-2 type transport system ATP-binding protein
MLKIDSLTKNYGSFPALKGLSLEIPDGALHGFVGPNGAGKTTTMRMLCGLNRPTSGRVLIDSVDPAIDPVAARRQLGYLPENAPLYGNMTVQSFLSWCGSMRGLTGDNLRSALKRVMSDCALENVADDEVESLSKGYRRRVCLAQSIIHRPTVLVMDEPTDGLDPNQKREIRGLIRQMRENCALIVSPHILEEIDAVCDRVLAICAGREVFSGSVSAFRAVSGGTLEDSFRQLTGAGDGGKK